MKWQRYVTKMEVVFSTIGFLMHSLFAWSRVSPTFTQSQQDSIEYAPENVNDIEVEPINEIV